MTVVAPGGGDFVGLVTIKNPGEPGFVRAILGGGYRRPIARSRVYTIYIWDRKFRCMEEGEKAGTDGASLPAKENNKNE